MFAHGTATAVAAAAVLEAAGSRNRTRVIRAFADLLHAAFVCDVLDDDNVVVIRVGEKTEGAMQATLMYGYLRLAQIHLTASF